MSVASALSEPSASASSTSAPRTRLDLPHLLDAAAQAFPNRPAFIDAGHRAQWSGSEARKLTLGGTKREVDRIAGLFSQFRLSPGSPVAIQIANSPEAALALIGAMRAGMTPLMLPVGLSQRAGARAIEDVEAEAAITQTQVGPLTPAGVMREIAAGYFGLRFVTAFGEDVPDGMIGLDRLPWSLAEAAPALDGAGKSIVATYDEATGQAYGRTAESLIAAGLGVVAAARMRPGQRILSLLPPDDLAGLATGVVPSLAAGIPLVMPGVFDSGAVKAALSEGQPTHLVAPAWLEPVIAAAGWHRDPSLAGIVFVHKLPWERRVAHNDSGVPTLGSVPVLDVLALGEYTLFMTPRLAGMPASFDIEAVTPRLPSGHALVEARLVDGMLEVRGRAARCRVLAPRHRDDDVILAPDTWAPLPFAVETEGTQLTLIDRLQRGA